MSSARAGGRAVDTTGCGDVFHGAYAAALVHGYEITRALRFAAVAAGLKATCPGGQAGIPSRAAVETEMEHCVEDFFIYTRNRK